MHKLDAVVMKKQIPQLFRTLGLISDGIPRNHGASTTAIFSSNPAMERTNYPHFMSSVCPVLSSHWRHVTRSLDCLNGGLHTDIINRRVYVVSLSLYS